MRCEKYESTGNDFILLDFKELENAHIDFTPEGLSDLARRVCHRHFGIGADGILVLDQPGNDRDGFKSYESSVHAHCRMYLVNSDGSPAEMSGNGIRCFAAYASAHEYGEQHHGQTKVIVETVAGVKEVILREDSQGTIGDVDMGAVSYEPYQIPYHGDDAMNVPGTLLGKVRQGYAANSGIPHWMLKLDSREELEDERLSHEALVARYDERFPELTNVSVVYVESPDKVVARVFERGAHETLSCGTGATAIASVLNKLGEVNNEVTISLRGGELLVTIGDSNILSGPVNFVSSCDYAY